MDILEGLNEKQIEAVTTTEGYVRVIAGAGSGKTRALASRFAYLVNDLGIMPGHILCVTFTNKSAREMAMRIHRLTGDSPRSTLIGPEWSLNKWEVLNSIDDRLVQRNTWQGRMRGNL